MLWVIWNSQLFTWTNDNFRDDYKSVEELEYEHNECGIALWLLWAR